MSIYYGKYAGEKGLKMIRHKNRNNPEALKRMVLCRLKGHTQYAKAVKYNGTQISIIAFCNVCGCIAEATVKMKGVKTDRDSYNLPDEFRTRMGVKI
jgi:hypothetical protein